MSRLIRWAITLVIIALLVVFARNVDWSAAWAAIRGASPSLLAAAFIVNAISLLLRGVRIAPATVAAPAAATSGAR